MGNYQNDEIEIDLKELFFVWLEKVWSVLICTLVGMIVAAVITLTTITPMYQSSSQIYIVNPASDLSSMSLSDLQLGTALTSDYMTLITGRTAVEEVINNLNLNMTYEEFIGMVTVTNPSDTRFLDITVKNSDPYMAKTIVDNLTEVSIKRIAKVMELSEPNVTEYGVVNEDPVSPNLKKNILMGGILGFLLASAIVIVLYLLNDSIKSSEDIERYLGLETLAIIPLAEGTTKKVNKVNIPNILKRGRFK
jgi:capsular polysaccharide biosynthesis protein